MELPGYSIPEKFPTRLGVLVSLPRRIVWKLVRPYIESFLQQQVELERRLFSETAAMRKDIMATNYRVTWVEGEVESVKNTTTDPTTTP